MNMQTGYFSITNPLDLIDRWLHPYCHSLESRYRERSISIVWTERAERAFNERSTTLTIEMQIYFSCVIKKRTLFYESTEPDSLELEPVPVNRKIQIASRTVQSGSCSPEEFAKNYPIKRELTSGNAKRMYPKLLKIDYRNHQWIGEFSI